MEKDELLKILESMKCNEYAVRVFGKYEARTWDEKHLVNAVLDEIINKIK